LCLSLRLISYFQKYNQVSDTLSTHAPFFYCRGSTKLKLKKYLEALQDFNLSISLENSHEPVYFKKGSVTSLFLKTTSCPHELSRVALFELEEYESAREAFEASKQRREQAGKDISLNLRWIRKCDAEITGGCILISSCHS
jgi:tetratricopeptide (TPR) repeat protein